MTSKIVKNTDVLIVGGGPVGTVLNLLLNRCGVSNLLIEKRPSLSNKPRAHYISNRSMEVLRHLGHVDKLCQKIIPPLEQWRYISYFNDIMSTPIATRDCFSQYYTYNTTYYDPYSPSKVGNLGQNILSLLLNSLNSDDVSRLEMDCEFTIPLEIRKSLGNYDYNNHNVHFGTKLVSIEVSNDGAVAILDTENGQRKVNCKYLIGADGIRSTVKDKIGLTDSFFGQCKSYYVAIHIESRQLQMLHQKTPSMLKFICGKQIAVLVWYRDSEFVLHVPCLSQELQTNFDIQRCIKSVSDIINVKFKIKNCTYWTQNMSITRNFTDKFGRVILIGDAAHQLIPSGGFGMNLGINDAYSLYWRLHYLINNNISDDNRKILINNYATERSLVSNYAIKVAAEVYNAGKVVPSIMGYNITLAKNLVTTASLFTSTYNIDKLLNMGTRFTNYITTNPLIGKIIKQKVNRYLCNDNCAIRLTYPAADLNYQLIYPNIEDVKSQYSIASLDNYYKMTPIGLKTPKCAWKVDSGCLIGRRIPHFWIYYEITHLGNESNMDAKKVIRLSTVDFTSIFNAPNFVYLTFSENTQLRISGITSKNNLLQVIWFTDHLVKHEDYIRILDNPLHILNPGKTNVLLQDFSKSKIQHLRVFSSKSALEQFKIIANIHSHSNNIGIVIRPDAIVTDILYN